MENVIFAEEFKWEWEMKYHRRMPTYHRLRFNVDATLGKLLSKNGWLASLKELHT